MIYYILFNFSLSFIILLTYAFLGFNLCKAFTSLICSLILFFLSFNFNCSIFSFNLSICIKYLSNFVVLYLPLIILICSLILSILFVDPPIPLCFLAFYCNLTSNISYCFFFTRLIHAYNAVCSSFNFSL